MMTMMLAHPLEAVYIHVCVCETVCARLFHPVEALFFVVVVCGGCKKKTR